MDDDKHLAHESPSFQEQVLSSWASLKQKIWPLVDVETCESMLDDSTSNDRIVHALESLLDQNISCAQLQNKERLAITSIEYCQQIELWDCGKQGHRHPDMSHHLATVSNSFPVCVVLRYRVPTHGHEVVVSY